MLMYLSLDCMYCDWLASLPNDTIIYIISLVQILKKDQLLELIACLGVVDSKVDR
jgi:hypothetical protein